MSALTLIFLSVSGVYSDSHFLTYYYTGVSAPGYGLPEFSKAGYVDDKQIDLYSSDTGSSVPVAPWVKRNERPEYWERSTRISKEHEAFFRHEMKLGMKRRNHTGGFHFVQVMHGCELRDDGSAIGYNQYRYDGEEYMYLDSKTGTYIPTKSEAQITAQRWNSPDVREGEKTKNYLENECIDNLRRFFKFGKEDLERRVRPEVRIIGRKLERVTKLHCLVYGFHPRAVDVKWMKNGMGDVPSYETTGVLPNPDGTYQIRVTAEVIPKEGDTYSCYVDHSSLGEPLLVRWVSTRVSHAAVITGAVVIVVLISITSGVLMYKKKKDNDMAADTLDMSSASNRPVTA